MRKTRSGRLVTAAFLLLIGILAAVTLTCCTTEGTGTPVISDPQPTALERDPRHTDAPEPGEIRINEAAPVIGDVAMETIERTLSKALFWESHRHVAMNERQTKMVNMLWDGSWR